MAINSDNVVPLDTPSSALRRLPGPTPPKNPELKTLKVKISLALFFGGALQSNFEIAKKGNLPRKLDDKTSIRDTESVTWIFYFAN